MHYFQPQSGHDLTRDEVFIIEQLATLMNVASTNSQEVAIYNVLGDQVMDGKVFPIGASLEPSLVLLNHSCDANTIKVHSNGRSILMADRTIQEGEEVNG